ncbi:MAG: thiamine ABC transporter substrate-binding protein [Thermoflexales bacterium]|nr:thiamine ABC transporter substrate-binding protein [Thermoflexales bacterium]MCS7325026.1 thiamine ABC transporter substrate-binding protein [Thermoflexales bacterium]MDW8054189.1 thiamine ABC transporter substrate-binding protein [Anaerolineae bacterium]MDW8292291.1 thiamine ABC transporter substrate-binding protein [Anaerolineae bacterium]
MIKRISTLFLSSIVALASACAVQAPPPAATPVSPAPAAEPETLVIMSHDSFNVSESVIRQFEQAHNVKVQILESGDTGSALNKAILSKDAPLADVFFGVDNTFMSRALDADIFEPYASPRLAAIPERFKLDKTNRLLPVDYGHVMVNYDKAYFSARNLEPPRSLRDLADPRYKGLLVVQNPATSSPGLAFLMATIAAFPEGSAYPWTQFWADLRANDVYVSPDWEDAYFTQFSGSSGKGPRPLVVSYATSPAAEVVFSEGKLTEPPTGNVEGTAFEQIEFVGILKGTKKRALAEKWVDFMLSRTFQEDIPLQMFVYPVLPEAQLPEVFIKFGQPPANPLTLPPQQIHEGRERWIERWTEIVLR